MRFLRTRIRAAIQTPGNLVVYLNDRYYTNLYIFQEAQLPFLNTGYCYTYELRLFAVVFAVVVLFPTFSVLLVIALYEFAAVVVLDVWLDTMSPATLVTLIGPLAELLRALGVPGGANVEEDCVLPIGSLVS